MQPHWPGIAVCHAAGIDDGPVVLGAGTAQPPLKELMQRTNRLAIRDTVILLGILIGSAIRGVHYWGGWAAVPFFVVYGDMCGSAAVLALARVQSLHSLPQQVAQRRSLLLLMFPDDA